jgi:hypothetical protein
VRLLDLTKSAEDVKATAAILKTQINFTSTFIDLPEVVKITEKQIEQKQAAVKRMQEANAASGIYEVGSDQ